MSEKPRKSKKGKPEKISQVDKTFYELTITDLNKKLARLRSLTGTLDDANFNLKEQLRSLEEDRADVAAHLERTLAERNNTINHLEERLEELIKLREKEKLEAAEQIKDLEMKYKAMHDQLNSEIRLLNGKLNSLDEFRLERDTLLAKFSDQEEQLLEKDRSYQELIYNMEQKAVVEKDALKKEVEAKLLQVSEDFTRSSEIRNAGYTRRLIRENIALQKEIDVLVLSQMKMQHDFDMHIQRNKVMAEQYAALAHLKIQLIKSAQNKINIIEILADNYEHLKIKYIEALKYKSQYKNLMKKDIAGDSSSNEMNTKLKLLGQRIEGLKMENSHLMSLHDQDEAEISRLKGVIQQIKLTVESAIQALETLTDKPFDKDEPALKHLKRSNLLTELLNLVSSHSKGLPDTPSLQTITRSHDSLYHPGKMGLLPRPPSSLMNIFRQQAPKPASADQVSPEFQLQEKVSLIIPKARSKGGSIIDAEVGSLLVVSSSHENMEIPQSEVEEDDGGEEASSSDFVPTQPEAEEEKAESIVEAPQQPEEVVEIPVPKEEKIEETETDIVSRMSRLSQRSVLKSMADDTEEFSVNQYY